MSTSNPIELLSRIAAFSDEEATALFGMAGREGLLEAITQLPTARARPARRRLRRPLVIAVAAIVAAAATGAGWAITRGPARETTSIQCMIAGGSTVIDATSGDPAADCAVAWQHLEGTPAPPLTAYDNRLGGVTVLPSSQNPPADWQPVPAQDVALIELQESLDDYINGLNSACFDTSAGTAFAQRQLDTLGLAGWTIKTREASQAKPPCTIGFTEPTTKTLTLIPVGSSQPADWLPRRLANSLRPLTKGCLSLPAMRSEVEQRASGLGLSQTANDERHYELRATRDDRMRCTTLYETVDGSINLVLRGPAQ